MIISSLIGIFLLYWIISSDDKGIGGFLINVSTSKRHWRRHSNICWISLWIIPYLSSVNEATRKLPKTIYN